MKHNSEFSDRMRKQYNMDVKWKMGIKWKMWIIIVVFIICVLVSIWVLQVQMLNFFYQTSRFYELDDTADEFFSALDNSEPLIDMVDENSKKHSFDIWIFESVDGDNKKMLITHTNVEDDSLAFDDYKMTVIYEQAVKNGGKYIATVPVESFWSGSTVEVYEDNYGNGDNFPKVKRYSENTGAVYARTETVGEKTYLLVQYTSFTPVQTMVNTLRHQFYFIGFAMILMAFSLAALLSKMITKPFIKMNDAAKKLAVGNYEADFSGRGYREINELAMTLNYASHELAKTDNLQKELISNISHDLRTPLTMIKGYSEVIRDIPGENTPENIQVIIDETTRLSELVNDMLDLSKIQSGTRKPDYEMFSITETVRDTLTRYEKLTMQEGYKIDYIAEGDASVIADRGMMLQVIYNLINNAINYTGSDKQVTVTQTLTETAVRIAVSDTGEGITEKDLEQIWNRYYRVDKLHRRATIGTGLGLSIVKEILEVHGASYGVDSEIGKGSTFWFELQLPEIPRVINAQYEETEDGN
jgi:signal transduction histidine kinase